MGDVDLADHNVHNVSCSGSTINFNTVQDDFKALQYSLFISVIVEVLGAFFFFITAWYIIDDKARVDRAVADALVMANNLAAAAQTNDSENASQSESQRVDGQPVAYVNHAMEE